MKLPITEALEAHVNDISFHTPAHNGGILNNALRGAAYDITELAYSDNLLAPEGIIKKSEEEVAGVYNTQKAIYSTAGATALIRSAIYAQGNSAPFLVYGNAHKSVYNALRRMGAKAYSYKGADLRGALRSSGAAALIITSPDYYGNTLDLPVIKAMAEESGVKTIVDAAHGGHFAFSSKLPVSATEYFDTVIHSLHKTLPVLTGGAVLHVSDKDYEGVMRAFREVHTTSPSYPVMASIECAVASMEEEGEELYDRVLNGIEDFREAIACLPIEVVPNDDPTRLVVKVLAGNAADIAAELEAGGIYAECYDYEKITFIVTPFNCDKLPTLAERLRACGYGGGRPSIVLPKDEQLVALTFGSDAEVVPLTEAEGRVLYEGIGVYPPGTPIALSGEKLSREKLSLISELSRRGDLSLFGLENGNAVVLK